MITISSTGSSGTSYYKIVGALAMLVPGTTQILGPYSWSPQSGFAHVSYLDTVNSAPPEKFSTGVLFQRDSIGKDNNCWHTQVYGNVNTTIESIPSSSSWFTPTGDQHYGLPTYKNVVSGGWSPGLGRVVAFDGLQQVVQSFTGLDASYGFTMNNSISEYESKYYITKVSTSGDLSRFSCFQSDFRKSDELYQTRLTTFDLINAYVYRSKVIASYKIKVVTINFDGKATHEELEIQREWFIISTQDVSYSTLTNAEIENLKRYVSNRIYSATGAIFSELETVSAYSPVKKAVESISSLDMNNIENSSQLKEMRVLLPSLIRTLKDLKRHPVKSVANLYLFKKYGIDTSVRDISQIIKELPKIMSDVFDKIPRIITRYGTTYKYINLLGKDVNCRLNAKVRVKPLIRTSDEVLMHKLSALGLEPGLANGWDLIPFSFVVDWFIGIGDFLSELDYNLVTRNRFNLDYLVFSVKGSTTVELGSFANVDLGTVSIDFYYRRCDRTFPQAELNFGSSSPTKHILDGLALIIANW